MCACAYYPYVAMLILKVVSSFCYYSQDIFRRALVHPGPPENFALQTVQEAIKPQVTALTFVLLLGAGN